jgi:hypothetical protein
MGTPAGLVPGDRGAKPRGRIKIASAAPKRVQNNPRRQQFGDLFAPVLELKQQLPSDNGCRSSL